MNTDDDGVYSVAFDSVDPLLEAALVLQDLRQSKVYQTATLSGFLDEVFAGEDSPVHFPADAEQLLVNYLLDAMYYLHGWLRFEEDPVVLQTERLLLEALLNFERMREVVSRHYPALYAPDDEDAVESPWMKLLRLLSASLEIE